MIDRLGHEGIIQPDAGLNLIGPASPVSTTVGIILDPGYFAFPDHHRMKKASL